MHKEAWGQISIEDHRPKKLKLSTSFLDNNLCTTVMPLATLLRLQITKSISLRQNYPSNFMNSSSKVAAIAKQKPAQSHKSKDFLKPAQMYLLMYLENWHSVKCLPWFRSPLLLSLFKMLLNCNWVTTKEASHANYQNLIAYECMNIWFYMSDYV